MTTYLSLLQQFAALGGHPEKFDRAPTLAELEGLVNGMLNLKEKYPRFWRVER